MRVRRVLGRLFLDGSTFRRTFLLFVALCAVVAVEPCIFVKHQDETVENVLYGVVNHVGSMFDVRAFVCTTRREAGQWRAAMSTHYATQIESRHEHDFTVFLINCCEKQPKAL